MTNPLIKPEYVYKYVDAKGAIAILKNPTLIWRPPNHFNDPFDTCPDLNFPFNEKEFLDAYKPKWIETLYNDVPLYKDVEVWAKMRSKRKTIDLEDHEKFFNSESIQIIKEHLALVDNFKKKWIKDRENFRIICVSSNRENLLMWAHYAEKHSGAKFRFKCINHPEAHFKDIQQVNYSSELPIIATLSEWVNHVIGTQLLNSKEMTEKALLTKSIDWKYEEEWRTIGNYPGYDYMTLMPKEIDAIYLGCNMTEENKIKILSLAKDELKHLKVYEASRDARKYALTYKKIN